MLTARMHTCLNCERPFEGHFCNHCGQKASTHRFTMHEWAHEIPHTLLHVDGNFVRTMWALTTRGGDAVREFLAGKRKSLYPPFVYALLWSGAYVLVSHWLEAADHQSAFPTDLSEAVAYIQAKYFKVLMVGSILPMALGTTLAFRRAGYNFAEHLVLNMYLMSQLIIVDTLRQLLLAALGHEHESIVTAIDVCIEYPYWFWFYWRFFTPENAVSGAVRGAVAIATSNFAIFALVSLCAGILVGMH